MHASMYTEKRNGFYCLKKRQFTTTTTATTTELGNIYEFTHKYY